MIFGMAASFLHFGQKKRATTVVIALKCNL